MDTNEKSQKIIDLEKADNAGKIEEIKKDIPISQSIPGLENQQKSDALFNAADYIILFESLKKQKKHLTSAPTFIPTNLIDQIQFYDDGATPTPVRRVYFYVKSSWSYITLT